MIEEPEEQLPEKTSEEEVEEEKVEKIAEKIIEGEEGEVHEEAPEEYIPEELEEPLPAGALDIRAIEIMTEISDLITKAVQEDISVEKIAKEVTNLKRKLVRRHRGVVRKVSRKTAKTKLRKSMRGGKKVKRVRRS